MDQVDGNSAKKRKLIDANFTAVLLECGVASIDGDKTNLCKDDDGDGDGDNGENDSNEHTKTGTLLDVNMNPTNIRSSIHGLLSEMHRNGTDVDNEMVLESMEEFIMGSDDDNDDQENENTNANTDTEGNSGTSKNKLLHKMLLPMTGLRGENENAMEYDMSQSLSQFEAEPNGDKVYEASLIKVLLRVEALQPRLLHTLLQKLQELATEGDKVALGNRIEFGYREDIPRLVLSHIRWMELIVNPMELANAAMECMSVLCTTLEAHDGNDDEGNNGAGGGETHNPARAILLELIATLPDIIDDGCVDADPALIDTLISQLRDIRVQDATLLLPCLDAVSSLRFTSEEQIETIVDDALEALESVTESWLLPPLCKFLVQNVPRNDSKLCARVIDSFRKLRLGLGLDEEEGGEAGTSRSQVHHKTDSEALMLEALTQGFTYRNDLTNALISAIKCTAPSQHGAADLWLLWCCHVAAHHKAKVGALIKAKSVSGGFGNGILRDAVRGNGAALHHMFSSSLLPLADSMVRSNEQAARDFGGHLYEELFLEIQDRMQRQEIVGQLIIHVASGMTEEIDTAMKVFSSIVASGEEGMRALRLFLPFLMSLIDNVQNYTSHHLRTLFLLLFLVGGSDNLVEGAGGLDDVHIVIRKYLALAPVKFKRIGIIGAVCYASCVPDTSDSSIKEVVTMLELSFKSCISTSSQHHYKGVGGGSDEFSGVSAQSIFFDELCLSIQARALPLSIKGWILDRFSNTLEDTYFGDLGNSGEHPELPPGEFVIKDADDKALVSGESTNTRSPRGELRFNIDKNEAVVYIKLLSLHASEDSHERHVLSRELCPLLRLVSTSFDERYGGDGIGNIDALLGCPLLLPDEDSSSIEFMHLPKEKQLTTISTLFTAVSWCREVINAFAFNAAFPSTDNETQFTQDHLFLRQKVVEKLRCLLELEEEVTLCSRKCYSFTPPGLQPLQIPKDLLNQDAVDENEEPEDILNADDNADNGRMTAEEKKAWNEIKKAAKKKATDKMKAKHKVLKVKSKFELQLETRTRDAIKPLNPYACLALGFPELRVGGSAIDNTQSSQELILSLGASELKHLRVGDKVTNFLLTLFQTSLSSHFESKSSVQGTHNSENPYSLSNKKRSTKSIQKSGFEFLGFCIDADVFVSIHERLVAVAEILGDEDSSQNNNIDDTIECMRLLLQCVGTLLSAGGLNSTSLGRGYLHTIIKQIAEGEEASASAIKPIKSHMSLLRSLATLFDLIEEAISNGCDTNDLEFTMTGVDCVDQLVRQAVISSSLDMSQKQKFDERVTKLKQKLSKLCLKLLRHEWQDGTAFNKGNVGRLIQLYLEYYSSGKGDILDKDFDALQWGRAQAIDTLINEALVILPSTESCKGPVSNFFTCCRLTFGSYFSSVLAAVPKEMMTLFQTTGKSDGSILIRNRLAVVGKLIEFMKITFDLTKNNPPLAKSSNLLMQLKSGTKLIDIILKHAIPFCVKNFKGQEDCIVGIIESTQTITKQMNFIVSHGKRSKDASLVKESPKVRKVCEEFIHKTKALLQKNNVIGAFWGGNLHTRNIDGSKFVAFSESDEEKDEDQSQSEDNEANSEEENSEEEDSDTESENED